MITWHFPNPVPTALHFIPELNQGKEKNAFIFQFPLRKFTRQNIVNINGKEIAMVVEWGINKLMLFHTQTTFLYVTENGHN